MRVRNRAPKHCRMTPAQLRMARTAVSWSRQELATRSGTSFETLKNYELRGTDPRYRTMQKWRRTLEAAGVVFLEPGGGMGPGVRLLEPEPEEQK